MISLLSLVMQQLKVLIPEINLEILFSLPHYLLTWKF